MEGRLPVGRGKFRARDTIKCFSQGVCNIAEKCAWAI